MYKLELKDIPSQYSELVEFLGLDLFMKFCDFFGGSHVYVPTKKTLSNIVRDKEIVKAYQENVEIKCIARKYNVTQNCIRKIVKRSL